MTKIVSAALTVAAFCFSPCLSYGADQWTGSWAAAQQIPEAQNALSSDDLRDGTLRQIVHLSVGGPVLRVRLSNAFGTEPLHLDSVHIARPLSNSSARIDTESDRALSFHGAPDVIIPPGADFLSDPVQYPVQDESDLAVSIHYEDAPDQQTGHPGSRATSYLVHGNAVSAPDLENPKTVDHWYQLSGIDVAIAGTSIVALGDSITDGHGATTNGNDRWTDVLARRLQAAPPLRNIGVLNEGIGGNHLLTDGLGPNALARFDRDVLGNTHVKYLIVLEGVNDLGGLARSRDENATDHDALVGRILSAYSQIIARAHATGIKVIGGTITPFAGSTYYHPGAISENDRTKVNEWIRVPGHFDAVVDFAGVLSQPDDPQHLRPEFDSGDHLHPSPAGYAAMGKAISLSLFTNASR